MTTREAINDIRENIQPIVGGKSLDMAISALKKQIPKKPNNIVLLGSVIKTGKCPKCNVQVNYTIHYCDNCGQALDWGGIVNESKLQC